MPGIYGQQSTFSTTSGNLRLNIEDTIAKYPDEQFALLKRLTAKNFKNAVLSHKYEWTTRDHRPVSTTVVNATVSSGATTFVVNTPSVFNKDDILFVKRTGEQMRVTYVAGGVNLTVTRSWGDSTAAGLVAGDTVTRIGVAAAQGALADNMVLGGTDDLYNYTQIFEDVVEMSDTQYNAMIHGDENSSELIERKQKELMEALQSTLIRGLRYSDATNKVTGMGGMKYFVDTYAPTNAINFGGPNTWDTDSAALAKFDDMIETVAAKFAGKPTLYMGADVHRKLRLVQDDLIRSTRDDKSRGIGVVDTYRSDMGDLDIVVIRDRAQAMNGLVFAVQEDAVGYKAMKGRNWFTEEKPFAGDGHLWQVAGEFTFKMDMPESVSYMYGFNAGQA